MKECPVCHKELEPCITFSRKEFYACFACSYMTEPQQLGKLNVTYFDDEEGGDEED